jgi:hypothetical protein
MIVYYETVWTSEEAWDPNIVNTIKTVLEKEPTLHSRLVSRTLSYLGPGYGSEDVRVSILALHNNGDIYIDMVTYVCTLIEEDKITKILRVRKEVYKS